jgi:hypothetical protein
VRTKNIQSKRWVGGYNRSKSGIFLSDARVSLYFGSGSG